MTKKKDPEHLAEDPESQPRGKHKRGTQGALPGVLPQVQDFPEISRLAKKCKELRSEWQELGGKVAKSKDALAAAMHDRGIKSYIAKDLRVELVEGKELVKIKDVGEEAAED